MSFGWSGSDPSAQLDVSVLYELGTRFHANADVTVTDIRVWSPPSSHSYTNRRARIWNAGLTSVLATATLADVLPSGWTIYTLNTPVGVASGNDIWVTYDVNETYGAIAGGYPRNSVDNLVTATSGAFTVSPPSAPGTNTGTFYGIDIVYSAGIGGNQRPVAGLTVSAVGLAASGVVTITDESPSLCNVVLEWGDGAVQAGSGPQTFTHTYTTPGVYAVLVTVTDPPGLVDAAAAPLSVFGPTTADPILHQICTFFGGAFSTQRRAYITPTIAGVGQVKRGFEKNNDFAEFQPPGSVGVETGAQIVVTMQQGVDRRLTVPAVTGRRHTSYRIQMHCFLWSTARYAEDAQDARDNLRRAILAKIRTDPTLGSGGFEAGAFQVGEADDRGGGGDIIWNQDPPETDEQSGTTKLYLFMEYEAHELPVG